jgi:Domain of unknown function (DUF4129)
MSATGMRTTARGHTVATVGLAIAAVLLVAVVATGGRVPLAHEGSGGWHLTPRGTTRVVATPSSLPGGQAQPQPTELPGEGVLAVLAQAAVIIVGGTVLVLIGRTMMRTRRLVHEQLSLERDLEHPLATDRIVDAVDDSLTALASGPVDEVVVACWVRLEDAAAAAGAARDPSETPAELAARVLGDLHAPADAVAALLALYRTARYSHHALDDTDRATAIRSLQEIRAAIEGANA